MKKLLSTMFGFAIVILLSGSGFAQDGNYFTVSTWKIVVPEGGSRAEFLELQKEWRDKIVSKNEKIISERVMRHQSGSDGRDWVFITEYANWNDIDLAAERQNELVEEAWPNEEERRAFFQKFFSYSQGHSDEIYQESPGLRK